MAYVQAVRYAFRQHTHPSLSVSAQTAHLLHRPQEDQPIFDRPASSGPPQEVDIGPRRGLIHPKQTIFSPAGSRHDSAGVQIQAVIFRRLDEEIRLALDVRQGECEDRQGLDERPGSEG